MRNVVTSSFLERGKIPVVADTDREAFEIAFRSCGYVAGGRERIVRILDTLHLEDVYVSPALLDGFQIRARSQSTSVRAAMKQDLFDENQERLSPF